LNLRNTEYIYVDKKVILNDINSQHLYIYIYIYQIYTVQCKVPQTVYYRFEDVELYFSPFATGQIIEIKHTTKMPIELHTVFNFVFITNVISKNKI